MLSLAEVARIRASVLGACFDPYVLASPGLKWVQEYYCSRNVTCRSRTPGSNWTQDSQEYYWSLSSLTCRRRTPVRLRSCLLAHIEPPVQWFKFIMRLSIFLLREHRQFSRWFCTGKGRTKDKRTRRNFQFRKLNVHPFGMSISRNKR